MIYFTSDTHFGHEKMIEYAERPFSSVAEMDSELIKRWNERVDKEDTVFHLGDFCLNKSSEAPQAPKNAFEYYRKQLNGNIVFIGGNHDKNNGNNSVIESVVIKHGGCRIYMTHNPKFAKEDFQYNFCGHVHSKWAFQRLSGKSIIVNLSVENWDYRPVEINEIIGKTAHWRKARHE